jgi:universal stress protein A
MAYPFRSILTPIEFDDPTFFALGYAKQVGASSGAVLHLLHVVEKFPALGEPEVSENDNIREEVEARARLTELANQYLGGLKHQIHVAAAAPRALAKAIARVADEVNADLIVTRTHERKGFSQLILGAVAEEVLRIAPCPVLTFTSAAEERASHLRLQRSNPAS